MIPTPVFDIVCAGALSSPANAETSAYRPDAIKAAIASPPLGAEARLSDLSEMPAIAIE